LSSKIFSPFDSMLASHVSVILDGDMRQYGLTSRVFRIGASSTMRLSKKLAVKLS
jgi:hypothetical protein